MEKSEEKPPPAALGSQHCLPGDGSVPSWPGRFNGAHSGHLSRPELVLPSGAGWQHLGRMEEGEGGDTNSFPLWSTRKTTQRAGREKWRRRKRWISPHLPGAVPADSQTLGLCQIQKIHEPPKPAGLSLGADAPLNWKSLGAVLGGKLGA